jgi:hypothetical protein
MSPTQTLIVTAAVQVVILLAALHTAAVWLRRQLRGAIADVIGEIGARAAEIRIDVAALPDGDLIHDQAEIAAGAVVERLLADLPGAIAAGRRPPAAPFRGLRRAVRRPAPVRGGIGPDPDPHTIP